ncbi:uncharacterized protein [Rutidosis leptorrhynchoides]|uniref:uncharacterized protein n=1 Tax=Rutidosis leptorrhynchoides TaxID=125765 RepID=UPI003A99F777
MLLLIFFDNGKLLSEINHTIIALLPKVQSPCKVTDYRPISCCNVLYKCISKIITNRLKNALDDIVSINQSAFIPGRRISDNILLTQELMKNYHIENGTPRCVFKVDIQKAYDTVDWNFLEFILGRFGFHPTMNKWIMTCVRSTSFSICVNGDLHGFFKGKRGLRQGDPLSPYLFTLVMEVLSLFLNRHVAESDKFKFHPKCEKLNIINLCFADDLFLFSSATLDSVSIISKSLDDFKNCSGLTPSIEKSTAYFANVSDGIKASFLSILLFEEGKLPVKYLGVPLVSSCLSHRDCKVLVDRVKRKIDDCKNKFLSFAGRVQLVISVISSMQLYWQFVFILSASIIKEIRMQFVYVIGDVSNVSAWFDNWSDYGPLESVISSRDIHRAELSRDAMVRDIVSSDGWRWPQAWSHRYPGLLNISPHVLSDRPDVIKWRDYYGRLQDFSVSVVWDTLRTRSIQVSWFNIVWYAQCIPLHSFLVWLLIGEHLKTHVRLKSWDISRSSNDPIVCPFCRVEPDSHDHLFFRCSYPTQVWSFVKQSMDVNLSSSDWRDCINALTLISVLRSAQNIVAKLLFAAAVYFIWQERNLRLFKKKSRSCGKLVSIIFSTVRLKLISIRWKDTTSVKVMKDAWKVS